MLEAADFCNLDLEVVASHSDNVGVEPFLQQLDPDRLLSLVKADLLSEQELEQFRISRAMFLESPELYILWLSLMICGEKPQ